MEIEKKILKAIETGKLSLKDEGERSWYKYKLRITKLFWSRNFFDGYQVEVYDFDTHLVTIRT